MKAMEENNFIEPLLERAEEYGRTSYELFRLRTIGKISEAVSTVASRGLVIFVISMFIILGNIGAALWLGDILGKSYYGFFCVAGFYAIVGGILYFWMHNYIKRRVSDSIISQMLN